MSLAGTLSAALLVASVKMIQKRIKQQQLEISRRSQANMPSQLEIQLNTKKLKCYSALSIAVFLLLIIELSLEVVSDLLTAHAKV